MEGQQNNIQVSGSQSSNSNVSEKSVRPRVPKFDPNVYDMSVGSDDGHETKPRKGQRGAQARGARPGPSQKGGAKRGRPAGGSKSVNTRTSENTNNSVRNKNVSNDSDSENEIDKIDEQLECLEEKMNVEKNRNEWTAENIYTVIESLFQVLPIEAINGLKSMAIENKETQRFTWLNNCVASINPERFTEAREAATINSGTRTNASENEAVTDVQREEVATSNITRENVRHILHQETNIILETLEDKKRKKNLIVIGMEEGYDDLESVKVMLHQLGCDQVIRDIVGYPTRLGTAKWGRRRPIKIELRTERAVDYVIENKKWLKQTRDFFRVYINRDLNRQDRMKERDDRLRNRGSGNSSAEDALPGGRGPTADETQNPQGTNELRERNNQPQNRENNSQRRDRNTATPTANQQPRREMREDANSGGGGGVEGEEGVRNSTNSPRANVGEEEKENVGNGEGGVVPGLVNSFLNSLNTLTTAAEGAVALALTPRKEKRATDNTVEETGAEGSQNGNNSGNRAEGGEAWKE